MEGLEARTRVALQTRELVTPAKDTNWQEFQSLKPHAKAQATLGGDLALLNEAPGQTQLIASRTQWFNRLIYGDNLLGMAVAKCRAFAARQTVHAEFSNRRAGADCLSAVAGCVSRQGARRAA